MSGELDLRASDADREHVAARLGDACAEGRLTVEELSHRLEAAFAARTIRELTALTADLPAAAKPPAVVARPRLPRMPGMRSFRERLVASSSRDRVMEAALADIAPPLEARGYRILSRDEHSILFERDRRPAWTIVAAVFLFPVGLIALLHRERNRILLSLEQTARGVEVNVSGTAPLRIRRWFAQLRSR